MFHPMLAYQTFESTSLTDVKTHRKGIYVYDDDVYLEYYSGKWFHINYSFLRVLSKTHKLVQA
jgi:hypothetical protein